MNTQLNSILIQNRIAEHASLRRAAKRTRPRRAAGVARLGSRDRDPFIRASAGLTRLLDRFVPGRPRAAKDRSLTPLPDDAVDVMSTRTDASRTPAVEPMAATSGQASLIPPADTLRFGRRHATPAQAARLCRPRPPGGAVRPAQSRVSLSPIPLTEARIDASGACLPHQHRPLPSRGRCRSRSARRLDRRRGPLCPVCRSAGCRRRRLRGRRRAAGHGHRHCARDAHRAARPRQRRRPPYRGDAVGQPSRARHLARSRVPRSRESGQRHRAGPRTGLAECGRMAPRRLRLRIRRSPRQRRNATDLDAPAAMPFRSSSERNVMNGVPGVPRVSVRRVGFRGTI